MNRIRINVDRNMNYMYHMNAVAKCGTDNEYGRKYARLHSVEDLEILKLHEGKREYSPEVSEVLKGNFDVYIYNIWYEIRSSLMEYAESLQKRFNESDFTAQEDAKLGIQSKTYFNVYLCNAVTSGEEELFAEEARLVVGTDQSLEDAAAYIEKAYIRYLSQVQK